jgi:tRNA G18 (ribose-2'-O)-methylase SpoU
MHVQRISITSRGSYFLQVAALKNTREKRTKRGEFFVEGVRSITGAIKQQWHITSLLYEAGKTKSRWADEMLQASRAPIHYEVSPELFRELSDKEEPSELLATVKIPPDALERITVKKGMIVVVFDRPGSPGNLGSSIRSCDALGASGVIITGHAADIYHPHAVRGSMGSLFALPTVRLPSHKELRVWLDSVQTQVGDLTVIGTSEDGAAVAEAIDLTKSVVLVMGNETFGMAAQYRELCNQTAKIPMVGSASSLNVSCATTVLLYERMRQLRQKHIS